MVEVEISELFCRGRTGHMLEMIIYVNSLYFLEGRLEIEFRVLQIVSIALLQKLQFSRSIYVVENLHDLQSKWKDIRIEQMHRNTSSFQG